MISQSQAAQAIESYETQIQSIADRLDKILISRHGDDAARKLNVGTVIIPSKFSAESDNDKIESAKFFSASLWAMREECNSTLDWVQRQLEGDTDVSEAS